MTNDFTRLPWHVRHAGAQARRDAREGVYENTWDSALFFDAYVIYNAVHAAECADIQREQALADHCLRCQDAPAIEGELCSKCEAVRDA